MFQWDGQRLNTPKIMRLTMFARRMLASMIIIQSLAISGSAAVGAPAVTITSPADSAVLSANSVNVTGTASGSDAQWVQTDKADFDAGLRDNVSSNAGGNISLNVSISTTTSRTRVGGPGRIPMGYLPLSRTACSLFLENPPPIHTGWGGPRYRRPNLSGHG
jgi:hypothetical protein